MKAYKLNTTVNTYEKGRILCEHGSQTILVATPSKPQSFAYNETLRHLQRSGQVDEIDLINEKWIHPHLFKPIKQIIYNS